MERISVDGNQFEVEFRGSGEPVVTIHPALADAFAPLLAEPTLTQCYRLVLYHRRGYGGSDPADRLLTRAEHAADCVALMHALGVERAHVVAYSAGCTVALRLALDAPHFVGSCVLLETAAWIFDEPTDGMIRQGQEIGVAMSHAADRAAAVDAFLRQALGNTYRDWLDKVVPGGFEQTVADWVAEARDTSWRFSRQDAARIHQPVLAVLGGESDPRATEVHSRLLAWLPHAESLVIPGVNHALHMLKPVTLAEGLVDFFDRHPLKA